jgi:putative ABC transport system permease protein
MSHQPPAVLRRVLARMLPPGPVRDGLLGDLDELYAERRARGRFAADVWYLRQLLSASVHYPIRRLWAGDGDRRRFVDLLTRDLAFAFRSLARRPGFTVVVVLTLALGIGANTAVFSVVNGVLLKALPFPEDDRLAVVLTNAQLFQADQLPPSPPEYVAYRDQLRSWDHLAAYEARGVTATGGDAEPERLTVIAATWTFFPVLDREPLLGRVFTVEEDRPGSDQVAVLSHAYWQTHFAGDAGVIGRTVQLDGAARTIVGVMPADFRFPSPNVSLWVPMAFDEKNLPSRGDHSYTVVGRLRSGVTLAAAENELKELMTRLAADPAANFHGWHPGYLRALRAQIAGEVSRPLWMMLGAVALVLVIACANVANLMLVRAEERAREMSVRTALGAGRRRLTSQLVTETLAVAALGGAAGVASAFLGVEALRAAAPADLPRLDEIRVDATVLVFTALVTLGAAVLFGLAPALLAGRSNVQAVLRDEGRSGTAGRGRTRVRQFLVVSETALAVVLLVAAGLLLQSFRRLASVDPGFQAEEVLTARIIVSAERYGPAETAGFYEALLTRIRSLPGVTAAGAVSLAPLAGILSPTDTEVEGWVNPPDASRPVEVSQVVTPDYFTTLGIPLLEGRSFDDRDRLGSLPVAIVSEKLAKKYWPGRSALGGRIRRDNNEHPFAEVVGVVADVRQDGLDAPPIYGTFYLPHAQLPYTVMYLTVRSATEPSTLVSAIREELRTLDPSVPLYQVRTMEQLVSENTATQRFSMLLQAVFALIALSLSAVGLYGVLSFTVSRRTAEIGIRIALGAQQSGVRRMVIRQGLTIVLLAVALGVAGAFASARLLEGLLFGVTARDPLTYLVVVGVLVLVALVACWIPARRASTVDPVQALRAS